MEEVIRYRLSANYACGFSGAAPPSFGLLSGRCGLGRGLFLCSAFPAFGFAGAG
jgi:hypothetical protein